MRGLILSLVLVTFSACQNTPTPSQPEVELTPSEQREASIERNRERLAAERHYLESYADSSGLAWTRTGTGLRYFIYESNNDQLIQQEEIIELDYTLSLLTGEQVWSSADKGPMMMRVNKDNDAVLGMHEAALLLHKGDSAAILIPSHLAWGIAGDPQGIPPMSPVLYNVRIHE